MTVGLIIPFFDDVPFLAGCLTVGLVASSGVRSAVGSALGAIPRRIWGQ